VSSPFHPGFSTGFGPLQAATILMPDAEKLVVNALLDQAELAAFGGRIYTVAPKRRTFPLARVARFGGEPRWAGHPYWVDEPSFQVDVWAQSGQIEAYTLAEQMRACVAQRLVGVWPEGVVVAVKVTGLVQSTDTDFDPPKPRYRFTATMAMHPSPG
jgi:hypothetical protein